MVHNWAPKRVDLSQCVRWIRSANATMAMARIHSLLDKWLPVSIAPPDRDLEVCVSRQGWRARVDLSVPQARNRVGRRCEQSGLTLRQHIGGFGSTVRTLPSRPSARAGASL